MNTHCRYCKESFKDLNVSLHGRRVHCGRDECKKAYFRERNERCRNDDSSAPPEPQDLFRIWGHLNIPDKQSKLKPPDMVYCAACGLACPSPVDQRLKCIGCGAIWTLSWGYDINGVVKLARMDRWR